MLSRSLRPQNWDEVVGQSQVKQVLRSISKDPSKSPRSLIFAGSFGSGKTTCARIMAKEVNGVKDRDYDLEVSPFYYEFDSTVVGNVERIRTLRDSFSLNMLNYWKVIVFDEIHAASTQAQTALLKVLEDLEGRVLFIFCTTHVDKIIPTIRSRSLELQFSVIPYSEVVDHLAGLENIVGVIPEDIRKIIAVRSGGHMRDVHMLIDKFLLIGEENFRKSVRSSVDLYCDFFMGVYEGDSNKIKESLTMLLTFPLTYLERDMSEFMYELSERFILKIDNNIEGINRVVDAYGDSVMKITQHYFADWMSNIFSSGHDFYTGMLALYQILGKGLSSTNEANQEGVKSLKNRAVIR